MKRGRLRESYAKIEKHNDNSYTITLNQANTPFENAVYLHHEFLHILGFTYLNWGDDEKGEHRWIAALEKSFRRHCRTYWRGK